MTNEEIVQQLDNNNIYLKSQSAKWVTLEREVLIEMQTDCLNKIEELIAENELLKQASENNPLTLEEVKKLKKGDVVWLKYMSETLPIKIDRIDGSVLIYNCFRDMMTYAQYICNLNKTYFLYRNKPEEVEE